jgi:hypothetical protein
MPKETSSDSCILYLCVGGDALRRHVPIFAAAFTLMAAIAAPAGATVHYGSATFKQPTEKPSIGPQPPPCDQHVKEPWEAPEGECSTPTEGIERVTVAYDDQAGSLTLKVTVYDPQYWGAVLPDEGFDLGRTCGAEELEGNFEGEDSIYQPTGHVEGEANGVALHGYEGAVDGSVDWTGQEHIFAWQAPAFAHRDWRCLTLDRGGSINLGGWPEPRRPSPQLVCRGSRGYLVGYVRPRRCMIDRPNAPDSETLDLADLRWTSWGPTRATATGYDLGEHPGQPGSRPYRVRIVAFRVGKNPTTGSPMFTRVTEYSSHAPGGHTVTPY